MTCRTLVALVLAPFLPARAQTVVEAQLVIGVPISGADPAAEVKRHARDPEPGRRNLNGQPGAVQALEEVLRLSREAKAPLHVAHVTSSGL